MAFPVPHNHRALLGDRYFRFRFSCRYYPFPSIVPYQEFPVGLQRTVRGVD